MSVYDLDDFSARVSYAACLIARKGAITRALDACFEMYDGAAVAAALVRRSWNNPSLAQNLPRFIGADAIIRAELKAREVKNLSAWARELRATAEAEAKERWGT